MFFLLGAKKRRKSVFCAINIFAHFALLPALFNHGSDDDDDEEKHHHAGCHREGNWNADNKDKRTDNAATDKGDKAAQYDDGKQSGKQDGGDFVHQAGFIASFGKRQE